MSLHVAEIGRLNASAPKMICQLVEALSLYETNALFYLNPTFQQMILDHAVFTDFCKKCGEKLSRCHAVIVEENFRNQRYDHLEAGQRKVMAFLR